MAVSKKFRWTNADGESMEVDIGADGENVTVEGIPLDEVLDSKADKQNAAYGFSGGGNSSAASGGAVGSETNTNDGFAGGYAAASTSGGAAGYQASATTGFAGGQNSKSTDGGGAAGRHSTAASGGAVGSEANAKNGFAGGQNAKSTGQGAAVGALASAYHGGAVGSGATAQNGFAGGANAKCTENTDCIQLGEGTNSNEKTLQVYGYQMMDENGNIPAERLKKANTYSATPVQVGTWIDGNPVWRVAIPMTSVSEISLNTNNKSWSIGSDQILDRLSIINDTSNFIHIDSMIRFQNSNDYDPGAFATGWTEMFPGYFNGEAENVDYATHFYGWIEFVLPANNISAA